jgi:hypothetical protein
VLPDWNGRITAVDGRPEPMDWPDGRVAVRLWHPREAAPAEIAAWRTLGRQRRLVQPFEQIERDFTRIEPEADSAELMQCVGVRSDPVSVRSAMRSLGWHPRALVPADSGELRHISREFPDDGLALRLTCAERFGEVELGSAWFHRAAQTAGIPLPLGAIPARVYSEGVRNLVRFARGPQQPEPRDAVADAPPERSSTQGAGPDRWLTGGQ